MTKPKPPTPLQRLQFVVNKVDSPILTKCNACNKSLKPDEEFHLQRNNGLLILCGNHYNRKTKVHNV